MIRSEGTERIVVDVTTERVCWRYAGGQIKRMSRAHEWYADVVAAVVIHRA